MDSTKNKIALSNTGIYKIQNIVDMKLYLGSAAVSFTNRFGKHRHDLRKNKHHSVYLQNAWNKYGEDNFIFTPLKVCDAKECIEWEQFFLDLYEPEYNILKVAKIGGYTNQKRSQEFIDIKG
jgi:group I intron endonuclease